MESNSQRKVESELKEKPTVVWLPPELWREEGLSEVKASSAWSWESLLLTVKEFPVTLLSNRKNVTQYDHTIGSKETHIYWFVREENQNEILESLICKQSRIS